MGRIQTISQVKLNWGYSTIYNLPHSNLNVEDIELRISRIFQNIASTILHVSKKRENIVIDIHSEPFYGNLDNWFCDSQDKRIGRLLEYYFLQHVYTNFLCAYFN